MLDLQALQVLESLVLPGSEKVDLRDAKEVRPHRAWCQGH